MKYVNAAKDGGNDSQIADPSEQLSFELTPKEAHQAVPDRRRRAEPAILEKRIDLEPQSSAILDEYVNTVEALQYLKISKSSFKSLICRGEVRLYKLGGLNRFKKTELGRLITLPSPKGGANAAKRNSRKWR